MIVWLRGLLVCEGALLSALAAQRELLLRELEGSLRICLRGVSGSLGVEIRIARCPVAKSPHRPVVPAGAIWIIENSPGGSQGQLELNDSPTVI